jgi:hypothetical protein
LPFGLRKSEVPRMHLKTAVTVFVAGAFVVTAAASAQPPSPGPMTDAKIIASAMSAAPKAVAASATIIVMSKDGSMRVVRKGTNGYTCMPDSPTAPGPSAMCLDANAWEWAGAWMGHKAPPNKVGFMYMMAGGTDASNTDPYAKGPAPGNHWIKTGPHVMVVGPAVKAMAGYPKSADPDTTKPYVMWAGTPYEHLMIPMNPSPTK